MEKDVSTFLYLIFWILLCKLKEFEQDFKIVILQFILSSWFCKFLVYVSVFSSLEANLSIKFYLYLHLFCSWRPTHHNGIEILKLGCHLKSIGVGASTR